MAFTPNDSAIRVTPEIEKHLQELNSTEEIKAYLANVAVAQGLATRDAYDGNVLTPTALASTAPKGFARVVQIGDKKYTVEAATELELEKATGDLYRAAFENPGDQTHQDDQSQARDSATGRFVSDAEAQAARTAEVAELRMKMVRGEISPEEFIAQSGAFDNYLAERGVDMESLQEVSGKKFEQTWMSETERFVANHPEWPGGEANKDLLGQLIIENGLDTADPAEALEAVYAYAVENNLLEQNPEVELHTRIANAESFADIVSIMRPQGSSIFNH